MATLNREKPKNSNNNIINVTLLVYIQGVAQDRDAPGREGQSRLQGPNFK